MTIVVVILALVGCASTPEYVILEDMPYPGVARLKLDGIPFGLNVQFYSTSYGMDIPATISLNRLPDQATETLEALNPEVPDVGRSPMGTRIIFSGEPRGQDPLSRSKITYRLKVDGRGTLLEFEKEVYVYGKGYRTGPTVTANELRQSLLRAFGTPHSTHAEDHAVSHEDTYWWGVDERVLTKAGRYDFLNASWARRFFGKVIRANLYQYKSGDILLSVMMTDNYQWLENMRRAAHEN